MHVSSPVRLYQTYYNKNNLIIIANTNYIFTNTFYIKILSVTNKRNSYIKIVIQSRPEPDAL